MARPRPFSDLGQTVYFYAYLDRFSEWWALRDPRTGRSLTTGLSTSLIPDTPTGEDSPPDRSRESCN